MIIQTALRTLSIIIILIRSYRKCDDSYIALEWTLNETKKITDKCRIIFIREDTRLVTKIKQKKENQANIIWQHQNYYLFIQYSPNEYRFVLKFLLNIDDNIQAIQPLYLVKFLIMYHKFVSKNQDDDREYLFGEIVYSI